LLSLAGLLLVAPAMLAGQDRLKSMPGYERAQRMSREAATAVRGGTIAATWIDGKAFEYTRDGKRLHFDVTGRVAWEVPNVETSGRRDRGRGEEPERGRQFESTASPDGKLTAFYRNGNVWLSKPDGPNEVAVTTDGAHNRGRRHGELGLWRGVEPANGDVVVAGRHQARLLPLRRDAGA
jgi:dipeptidyl-peptidase-4